MGWLWGKDDPLKDIDPSLRDYLQQHAPKSYDAARPDAAPDAPSDSSSAARDRGNFASQLRLSVNEPDFGYKDAAQATTMATAETQAPLPRESLFQDGRYKHLWKTYRPQVEAEEAGKSDQEKLMDILGGYRQRQEQIKTVALENCADEQWAVQECFRSGSWAARMTMCRSQNRALERCVTVQSQFLRALGYLSPYQRPEAESERIQMHADTLYHCMLDQERQINEAKEKGLPVPDFGPLIREVRHDEDSTGVAGADPKEVRPKLGTVTYDNLPSNIKDQLSESRLKGKSGPEAELALKELNQEIVTHHALLQQLETRYATERQERLQRQERGEERMTDKFRRWFDMRGGDSAPETNAAPGQQQQKSS